MMKPTRWRLLLVVPVAVAIAGSAAGCESVLGLGSLTDRVADGGAVDGTVSPDGAGVDAAGDAKGGDGAQGAVDAGCPEGAMCNLACPDGGSTTVSGTVYDPAGNNPLYNAAVYVVPSTPLTPLPKGVPTGPNACSCNELFQDPAVTGTYTATDGTFTLANVPAGSHVPLVIQVGKWRRLTFVDVVACQDNPQLDKSLTLPSSVLSTDTDDNIPDIAVSTGAADTLECLLSRMGLPGSEYVAGAATTGHVHIFAGGEVSRPADGGPAGEPEVPAFPGAPASPTALWASKATLMPYDIVLLSCEGAETYDANPPALESYLNAGGRVFASHFHYAWFNGPTLTAQAYSAPLDWGSNLATWMPDQSGGANAVGGVIDQSFPQGIAMHSWLTNVTAIVPADAGVPADAAADATKPIVPAGELPIFEARYDAKIMTGNKAQQWIAADNAALVPGAALYFSFNTPVDPDAGGYCGRAVFSDLHAGGAPGTDDMPPAPGGCAKTNLSPQEKALEYMLFDLSSCLTAWTP